MSPPQTARQLVVIMPEIEADQSDTSDDRRQRADQQQLRDRNRFLQRRWEKRLRRARLAMEKAALPTISPDRLKKIPCLILWMAAQ